MSSSQLCLVPASLDVDQVLPGRDCVTILARPRSGQAACPGCGTVSHRVHSRRSSVLRDLSWQGRPVTLRLRSGRFRCDQPSCPRRTFTQRLDDVAQPYARRTGRVATLHRCIALAMGGEAGARLASRLAMPVSADTLLRAARAAGRDAAPAPTPRVMAVDDWAWRRGHRYGTILVDLEQNTVVDLLPDRTAQTLAAWLRAHPGVEILARDKASAYAEGARIGAPGAVQVADRWHMLRNLGETMRVIVERHHAVAQQVAREMMSHGSAAADVAGERGMPSAAKPGRLAPPGLGRRMTAFAEALRLSGAGASISGISRQLHVDRKTLRRWISTGVLPSWHKPRRGRALDVYAPYLERF